MKAKMIAVAVAGMLVGCGSGGGSVEFQSQKGEPEVLVVDEFKIESAKGPSLVQEQPPEFQDYTALKPTVLEAPEADEGKLGTVRQEDPEFVGSVKGEGAVNEVPMVDEYRYGLVQEEKPEFTSPVKGESLVHDVSPYAQNGTSLIQEQYAYAEETANGDSAFHEVEELAICQREGLQDQETCQAALSLIETGISEAKGEFDKNPAGFQVQSKTFVATAEESIKRKAKRDATFPEVIEFLVNSTLEEETFENRYTSAGYAIATYYYVRGIPEDHSNTGNPGLCADNGFCGDQYLKHQWH